MRSSTPFQNLSLPFPHERDVLLRNYSTFHIGGPALFFATAKSKEEMAEILRFCHEASLRFFILGKGSNTLFDDRGFKGLVIQNRIDTMKMEDNIVTLGSGYSFARLGVQTAGKGFSGLEFAAGIPATCGGAIFMNAGAGKQETKDHLVEVSFVNEEGLLCLFKREELHFSYRSSSFQTMKGAIVEAVFSLKRCEEAKKIQKTALEYRLKTQPYKEPSIGCIFRNPNPQNPAALLIDKCGLKGFEEGGAQVSLKHANFIVNPGSATAQNVLDLIKKVKDRVFKETAILLEEEIRFIPYE